ncbi:MAG: PASTA domain-containing protein, partial [Bacilli bacterium]|nr:PASTA domain-containing protein [Bacilli bacterium]
SFTYEPGSTMKIFSFMTAMEEGKYNGSATYSSGSIKVDDYIIRDWNKKGWGTITYDVGFTYSSNTAAVRLAQAVKRNKLHQYYSDLGFGSLTEIELSGELKGDIDFTYNSELASASYGQGVTVTPIQMIQALSTIVNDGTVMKPYIIDKIVDPNTDEIIYQGKKKELKKVYSTSTVNKIKELMDLTVNGGDKAATGYVYHTDAVRLIGKTGTANYIGSDGTYVKGDYNNIRSFAGVFPYDKPEYIIYVSVKDFKGASKDMGNIVKKLVESVAKYRNLDERPSDIDTSKIVTIDNYLNKDITDSVKKLQAKGISSIVIGDGTKVINQYPKKNTKTSQKARVFLVSNGSKITMPNVIGWSSNEFIDFCKLVGVKYELDGYGYITSSNISEGTVLNENAVISVHLKNIEPESLVTKEESGTSDDNKE